MRLFKPVGPHLSLTDVHAHWDNFHKQVNVHPSPWFRQYFTSKIIESHNKFRTQKLDYTDNVSKDCSDTLLSLVKQCRDFHLTITNPQLPIKDNLVLEPADSTSTQIAALYSHTTESCGLLDSLTQKLLSLDKRVADLYKRVGDLKRTSTPSGDRHPKPPPQQLDLDSSSQTGASTKQRKHPSDDKTPPWCRTPKRPTDVNEVRVFKGENYYFCPKCLTHGCWQTSHCHTEHNAQHAKEVEAAFEKRNPISYKKYLETKAARMPARSPTPPPRSASAYVANPATDLEAQRQHLAVSAANLNELHNIWMQSRTGSGGAQN